MRRSSWLASCFRPVLGLPEPPPPAGDGHPEAAREVGLRRHGRDTAGRAVRCSRKGHGHSLSRRTGFGHADRKVLRSFHDMSDGVASRRADDRRMIDQTDRRILGELAADGRISLAELGRRVSLSSPAVAERVQRLERAGVITGYRAELDPRALGYPLTAIVRVKPAAGQLPRVAELAARSPRSPSVIASPARTASSSPSTCARSTSSPTYSIASSPTGRPPRR